MNGIEKLLNEDDVYLKKSKDTYCYQCGACDPLNSYGVCFLCGEIPHIKTFQGLKKVIKGFFYWHFKRTKKLIKNI